MNDAITTIYEEGREAYSDDKSLDDNPYGVGTNAHAHWANGWNYAKENDPLSPENMEDDFQDSNLGDED